MTFIENIKNLIYATVVGSGIGFFACKWAGLCLSEFLA